MHSPNYAKLYDQARTGGKRKHFSMRAAWAICQTTTCLTGREATAQCCKYVKCQCRSSKVSLKYKTHFDSTAINIGLSGIIDIESWCSGCSQICEFLLLVEALMLFSRWGSATPQLLRRSSSRLVPACCGARLDANTCTIHI